MVPPWLALLSWLCFLANSVFSTKQLGSTCDPHALFSECGDHARCHPVQKQCGGTSIGVCLCIDGYRQYVPPLPDDIVLRQKNISAALFSSISSALTASASWTDCQPVARLGQRCTISPFGPMTYDGQEMIQLPEGAFCDIKTSQVKCSPGTLEDHGKCIDSLGKRSFGERCGERLASVTSCDASKRLLCLPAQQYRRCQCSPGFGWQTVVNTLTNATTSTCVLVGIGERCDNSFECNVAQYRSYHSVGPGGGIDRTTRLPVSIATCDAQTRRCRCDETHGFLPASFVVPNVNVTVRRRLADSDEFEHESILLRVELAYSRRGKAFSNRATPFLTETRCVPASAVSRVSACGEACSFDVDSASAKRQIQICQAGLTCHYSPALAKSNCVRFLASNRNDNEFQLSIDDYNMVNVECCNFFLVKQQTFLWLSSSVIVLLVAILGISVTLLVVRCLKRKRRNQKMAQDAETVKAASMALLETSSTAQVPQVWATFKITPWRT